MTPFKTLSRDRGGEWPSRTLTVRWPKEPPSRVTVRDTDCVEAHSLELYRSRWATNLYINRTFYITLHPPLHPQHSTQDRQLYSKRHHPCSRQEEEIGQPKVIQTFNTKRWTSSRTLRGHHERLEQHTWHFNPKVTPFRPLCFTLELTPFKTPAVITSAKHQKLTPFKTLVFYVQIDSFQDPCVLRPNWLLSRPCTAMHMAKRQIDSFQDPYVLHRNWLLSRPLAFSDTISGKHTPGSELSQSQPNTAISRPLNWIYTVF